MSLVNQIFSRDDWAQLYSRDRYTEVVSRKSADPHVSQHALHYLIAIPQSDETVVRAIENTKTLARLTKADEAAHSLTPLVIACMQGRAAVARALLSKIEKHGDPASVKKALNQPDAYGWTPAHHAKLTSAEIFEMLVGAGADVSLKTQLGGTCDDIHALTTLEADVQEGRSVVVEVEDGNLVPIREVAQEALERLTGLKGYRDNPYYPPSEWKTLWQMPPECDDLLKPVLSTMQRKYQQLRAAPPSLRIAKNEELARIGARALSLKAAEQIVKGEFICEYSGVYRNLEDDCTSSFFDIVTNEREPYLLQAYDAQEYGNASRFADTGFPNAACVQIDANGSQRKILIATREIDRDESILWVYELKAPVSWNRELPLSQTAIREFYEHGQPAFESEKQAIVAKWQNGLNRYEDVVEWFRVCTLVNFPTTSPTTMLHLHFSDLHYIYKSRAKLIDARIIKDSGAHAWMAMAVADRAIGLEESLKRRRRAERQLVAEAVLQQIGTRPLVSVVKFITQVQKMAEGPLTAEMLQSASDALLQYDPAADAEYPFATAYMGDILRQYGNLLVEDGQFANYKAMLASFYLWRELFFFPERRECEIANALSAGIEMIEPQMPIVDVLAARMAASKVAKRKLVSLPS